MRVIVLSRKAVAAGIAANGSCSLARSTGSSTSRSASNRSDPPSRARRRLDQSKGLLTAKLKRAGWNDEFMLKLLRQMQ